MGERRTDLTNARNDKPSFGERLARARRQPWIFVLAVLAASRLAYLVVGAVLAGVLPVGPHQRATVDVPLGTLGLWAQSDGEHYVRLAAGGYPQPFDPRTSGDVAFFPL